jgi:hypothetical protein
MLTEAILIPIRKKGLLQVEKSFKNKEDMNRKI